MLREFLYVDTDKVRSLLAQLDEGVEEEVKITEKNQKRWKAGVRNALSRESDTGSESSVTRSVLDAIFPTLEAVMESSGYLTDISEELQNPKFWESELPARHPEGSFVRITAPARLFDSQYVLRIFSGLTGLANGFTALKPQPDGAPAARGRTSGGRVKGASQQKELIPQPEDTIEEFPADFFGETLTARQLRGFAKMTRALFHPGLVLIMNPTGDESYPITARLQEGRRFLETDAEVVFARYGVAEQRWTVVGTIGSFSPPDEAAVDGDWSGGRDGGVDRAVITNRVNSMMASVARAGFADMPQHPGFSLVPFGVYRTIVPAERLPMVNGASV